MKWFTGSINDAVATSKSRKAVFVVFVAGQNEASLEVAKVIDSSEISTRLEQDDFVSVKLDSDSESYNFFSQIYKVVPVPSLFFIGTNGAPMEIVADDMTVSNLQMKIDSVLNRVEKAKNTLNDFIKAEQDSTVGNIPGPSTAVVSTSQNNLSTKTVTTLSDTNASSKLQEQDKIERARKLIELQRQQKAEEEKEEEKRRELERRKSGKDVQIARQKQQELEIAIALEERAKEKAQEFAAKERVRQQIAQDKLERKQREQALQKQANQQQSQEKTNNDVPIVAAGMTRIQFRLPSGNSHLGKFESTTTLRELRTYVTTNIELPFKRFTMSTSFPRRDLSAEDDSKTLTDLELVPTAVVLIIPLKNTTSIVTSSQGVGFLSRLMWAVFTPVISVYAYLSSYFTGAPVGDSNRPQDNQDEGSSSNSQNRDQSFGNLRRTNSTAGGNIHRLHSGSDNDNDENNTWNGNSTQQM